MPETNLSLDELQQLRQEIDRWARQLGFSDVGISDTNLSVAETRLQQWLDDGMHGEMAYMARHGQKRSRPDILEPGTVRVISASLPYWPDAHAAQTVLDNDAQAYVSRYALGRDYHKVVRKRLQKLAGLIQQRIGCCQYRVFTDSAPVLEKPLGQKAGLGWIGKHSNLIHSRRGSWFFLGEIYTDLPLPADEPADDHCGSCRACMDACPTEAIVRPYVVDARRCISYLTIELHGAIPIDLRSLIGNRIYGCDDCQLVCPWNRFASTTTEQDFTVRHHLDNSSLTELFAWSEDEFLSQTEGSPIRRIGYERWLRNLAVALGNAKTEVVAVAALKARRDHPSPLVREHVDWALVQHEKQSN